jgi:Ca2+/H+ antiporter
MDSFAVFVMALSRISHSTRGTVRQCHRVVGMAAAQLAHQVGQGCGSVH